MYGDLQRWTMNVDLGVIVSCDTQLSTGTVALWLYKVFFRGEATTSIENPPNPNYFEIRHAFF